MEGENTGPINIGNPGFFTIPVILMCSVRFFILLLYLFELIIHIILSGEFTMTELAENVKEVSYKPF
jgi:hypothetical protein